MSTSCKISFSFSTMRGEWNESFMKGCNSLYEEDTWRKFPMYTRLSYETVEKKTLIEVYVCAFLGN